MNCLAESEITEEKAGRASFRIHYKKGEDFKHYDFEAPKSVAGKLKVTIIPFFHFVFLFIQMPTFSNISRNDISL